MGNGDSIFWRLELSRRGLLAVAPVLISISKPALDPWEALILVFGEPFEVVFAGIREDDLLLGRLELLVPEICGLVFYVRRSTEKIEEHKTKMMRELKDKNSLFSSALDIAMESSKHDSTSCSSQYVISCRLARIAMSKSMSSSRNVKIHTNGSMLCDGVNSRIEFTKSYQGINYNQ